MRLAPAHASHDYQVQAELLRPTRQSGICSYSREGAPGRFARPGEAGREKRPIGGRLSASTYAPPDEPERPELDSRKPAAGHLAKLQLQILSPGLT
jgi:hypothetical protein